MAERVLITGARAVAALDIARSLRAAGYEPHLADCSPAWLARLSRTYLSLHSQAQLNAVARQLNERPRKTLLYRTPAETFAECVAAIS